MEDIKKIVAENISALRTKSNMTQLELAERLNYSDKAVSKWERAESLPDVTVLLQIADLFGVTLDYLVRGEESVADPVSEQSEADSESQPRDERIGYNRKIISYISEGAVWAAVVFAFVITTLIIGGITFQFLYFVCALPVAFIIRLVFNSVWFNPRHNYVIISFLMWSVLAALHITFLYFGINIALIYLIGVAGQGVIVLCSLVRKPKRK